MTEEALRREMQELGKRADSTMADTGFFEKDLGLCRDTKSSPEFQSTVFRAMRPFESAWARVYAKGVVFTKSLQTYLDPGGSQSGSNKSSEPSSATDAWPELDCWILFDIDIDLYIYMHIIWYWCSVVLVPTLTRGLPFLFWKGQGDMEKNQLQLEDLNWGLRFQRDWGF